MPLYRVTDQKLEPVPNTTFVAEAMLERKHLQKLFMADVSPLGEDLMVLSEEYGNWEDARRRIDVLCLDKLSRIVVVELKRTEDGGHMDLQAIRYAAMVSSMTPEQAIAAHAKYLGTADANEKAEAAILAFLELETVDDLELTDEVRIILVAANFSPEITTSVLWLNRQGLDVTCVRLIPYKLGSDVLVDVTQIIPLPEAESYEVRKRTQVEVTRKARSARHEIFRRFWSQFIERSRPSTRLFANRSTSSDHWLSAGIGRAGFNITVSITKDRARVECFISLDGDAGRSKAAFESLRAKREQIEGTFGEQLDWQELSGKIGCRVCSDLEGGWLTPEPEWPNLQDKIIETAARMEKAFRQPIEGLKI
jgi:Domain of unknown function (DUF4268)